jgi:hypothetical protein
LMPPTVQFAQGVSDRVELRETGAWRSADERADSSDEVAAQIRAQAASNLAEDHALDSLRR